MNAYITLQQTESYLLKEGIKIEDIASFTFMQPYKIRARRCKPYWHNLGGTGIFIFTLQSGFVRAIQLAPFQAHKAEAISSIGESFISTVFFPHLPPILQVHVFFRTGYGMDPYFAVIHDICFTQHPHSCHLLYYHFHNRIHGFKPILYDIHDFLSPTLPNTGFPSHDIERTVSQPCFCIR